MQPPASASDLVAQLDSVGVRLWEESGRIRYRAPRGVMTEARLAALRTQRDEVLAVLRDGSGVAVTPAPEARHEPFPLTEVQAAYLLGRRDVYAYGGVGCHGYGELAFSRLDPGRLAQAWQALIRRHDMLRAVIGRDGSQRVLAEPPPYQIQLADLRGEPPDRVAAAIAATRDDMDHRVYDPAAWPLFDLRVTLTGEQALVHFSLDFLIADFVSIQVLLDELHRLHADPAAELPPLSITFRDYLLAARRTRTPARIGRDREYWWRRIDELPGAPELPVLGPPAPPRFSRRETRLSPAAWDALRRRAGQHDVSPSGAVLAAFSEVIGRWSRRSRYTLNLTLLNRLPLHPQVRSLVGDFTSVNLLAVDRGGRATFGDRARVLQGQLWEDLDHQMLSGVEVIREIARRRGPEAALMPVVFTSAIGLGSTGQLADGGELPGSAELGYGISQTPQVWIDCQNIERAGGLATNWDIRDGVLPAGMADDMFAAFTDLLHRLADDDGPWEAVEPAGLPADQAQRRRRVNGTGGPVPAALLHEPLVEQAIRTPDRVAVIAPDRSLSYGELLGWSAAVASRLSEQGCGPGDIVGVVMDKGPEQVAGALAALLTGAAYLPIDTNQPTARRNGMLTDAGAKHLLTQSWLDSAEWPAGVLPLPVDAVPPAAPPQQPPPRLASPGSLAYICYTSGSTGSPKGVMISHQGAANTVHDINRRCGVGADDRVLGLASLGFDLSVYDIFGPLAAGGALVLPRQDRRGDPSHWAELCAEHGVTLWNSVPAQAQMLADYLTAAAAGPPGLRLALLSGDWIPVPLPDQLRSLLPRLRVVSLGGATEASIWSIWYPVGDVPPGWRSIPYGRPLTNQTMHVLDGRMSPCPEGVAGDIYIGGVGVALGYFGDREQTEQRFIRHPETGERLYRTGDLGRYLPDGDIEFLGREDAQVKIRGHRIELAEVETALLSHPSVGRAAAVVEGEDPLQRRLAAVAEPAPWPEGRGQAARLVPALTAAADAEAGELLAGRDPVRFAELGRLLDRTALLAIAAALGRTGAFDAEPAFADVVAATRAAPSYHWLLRRWLRALEREGMLTRDPGTGRLSGLPRVTGADLANEWASIETARQAAGEDPDLIGYFRLCAECLPELISGETDARELLFPQGSVERAEAAFGRSLFSGYGNRLAAGMLAELARRHEGGQPLRVMEIGAGHWGASAELIRALDGRHAEYLFTDLSEFFVNEARARFTDYPWVRYGVFDMNDEVRAHGPAGNTFDVIVAANVLHYARHAERVTRRLAELLRPGGWLVMSELTRESYQVLASLEFLFGGAGADFEDERADRQTFFTHEQWLGVLRSAGADVTLCRPGPDGDMSAAGIHAFAAAFKAGRARLDPPGLTAHLAARLPGYMVPARIQVADAIPLTGNGKVDRAALRSLLPARAAEPRRPDGGEPASDLERVLAGVWADVLPVDSVGRDQDFFELGGDSLLAAQLVGQILERVPEAATAAFDDLLRQMLAEPTVAALAGWLRDDGAGPATDETGQQPVPPATPLIRIGGTGAGVLRVLVHDAAGGLAGYGAAPQELTGYGPLAALVVPDQASYLDIDPSVLVQRVAADYVRLLLSKGHDRLEVTGHGLAALLAAEVARQLAESGADVTLLTAFAGSRVPFAIDDDVTAEYVFAGDLGADLVALGYPHASAVASGFGAVLAENPGRIPQGALARLGGDPVLADVAGRFRGLAARPPADRLAAIAASLPGAATGVPAGYEVFRHTLAGIAGYDAAPYAGDIRLLRPAGDDAPWSADPAGLWRRICLGELGVAEAAAGRVEWLREPSAAQVAALAAAPVRQAAGVPAGQAG